MMRLLLIALVLPLTACGTKGKLKTPSQIEYEEQKAARKSARDKPAAQPPAPVPPAPVTPPPPGAQ